MWASRWKITIGRPRKTSSQSGYFFVLYTRRSREATPTELSRARIARTSHLFREKSTESYCSLYYLVAAYHRSSFIFLWSCFEAHPSLHALITICPSTVRRRLAFFFPFIGGLLQLGNINYISGYHT